MSKSKSSSRRNSKLSRNYRPNENSPKETTSRTSPTPSTSFLAQEYNVFKNNKETEGSLELLTPPASGVKSKIIKISPTPNVKKKPRLEDSDSDEEEKMEVESQLPIFDPKFLEATLNKEDLYDDSFLSRLDMGYAETNALKDRGDLSPRPYEKKLDYKTYPNAGNDYFTNFLKVEDDPGTQKHVLRLLETNDGAEKSKPNFYQHLICGMHNCYLDVDDEDICTRGFQTKVNVPLCHVAVQKVVSRN